MSSDEHEKTTQPGRGPVSEGAWTDLTQALAAWAQALLERWREPGFRPGSSFGNKTAVFTTAALDTAVRTPVADLPIRGLTGVSVSYRREDAEGPDLWRAVWDFSLFFGRTSAAEKAVDAARDEVTALIERHPSLSLALIRLAWGPAAAEHTATRGSTWETDGVSQTIAVGRTFASVLEDRGVNLSSLATIEFDASWVERTVEILKKSMEVSHHAREIVALLNCPVVDSVEAIEIWEGEWHDHPCTLSIGYPPDELCGWALSELGYDFIPHDSRLDAINCLITFRYFVSADETADDEVAVNWRAEAYVRDVIDLIRARCQGDVGVLHLLGRTTKQGRLLAPPFRNVFTERPGALSHVPLRRVYEDPHELAITTDMALQIGAMFQAYSIEKIKVLGLPAAMDRLRAVFERYSPDEPTRIVDAVTGLEALFLSEGSKDELKYRLQVRLARLLGASLEERIALVTDLSKIYSLRSAVVHTGAPGKADGAKAIAIQQRAVDLLRQAVCFFITTDFARGKSKAQMQQAWRDLVLGDSLLPLPKQVSTKEPEKP